MNSPTSPTAATSREGSAQVMDIKEISVYLPHRYPFLLVDRVVSVQAGELIKGYKNVSVNEMFFASSPVPSIAFGIRNRLAISVFSCSV